MITIIPDVHRSAAAASRNRTQSEAPGGLSHLIHEAVQLDGPIDVVPGTLDALREILQLSLKRVNFDPTDARVS